MQLTKKYNNIADTMYYLCLQVRDSIAYADDFLPAGIESPEELFNLLKANFVFIHDPPNVELLQSFPTLMESNYWNIRGGGDCDCFCIACISCFCVLNFPFRVVLSGRSRAYPVHIYTQVLDRGSWRAFDLTNTYYGEERSYPYKQAFPLQIKKSKSDLKIRPV